MKIARKFPTNKYTQIDGIPCFTTHKMEPWVRLRSFPLFRCSRNPRPMKTEEIFSDYCWLYLFEDSQKWKACENSRENCEWKWVPISWTGAEVPEVRERSENNIQNVLLQNFLMFLFVWNTKQYKYWVCTVAALIKFWWTLNKLLKAEFTELLKAVNK